MSRQNLSEKLFNKCVYPKGKIACLQLHDYVLTVEAKYLQVKIVKIKINI